MLERAVRVGFDGGTGCAGRVSGGVADRDGEGGNASLLEKPLEGEVFVGEPECSPCTAADAQEGRVFRLFLQVYSPERGVLVKLAGKVSAKPAHGPAAGDVHRSAPAALQRTAAHVQRWSESAVGEPPELRDVHDHDRP